ncbi:hypothetical protein [Antribacter gilvus]|uniref:hypothetical protein n=1 Tax=Antribacter gilvus TaxID=2304675 RepID=UPI000F78A2F9|nr:hypothetical protein [Antribacter gilvus]
MTATTERLSVTAFTAALREMADWLDAEALEYQDVLSQRGHPGQDVGMTLILDSREAVEQFAERAGVEVDNLGDQVWATKGFGVGSDPRHGIDAYSNALTVRVAYVAPVTDDEAEAEVSS